MRTAPNVGVLPFETLDLDYDVPIHSHFIILISPKVRFAGQIVQPSVRRDPK
jgi:hypothetical protein